jgi:hypothetical protein
MKTSATRRLVNHALSENTRRSFNDLLTFTQASPAYLVQQLDLMRKAGLISCENVDGTYFYRVTPTALAS